MQTNAAQLQVTSSFPVTLKNKAVFIAKRNKGPVPKEKIESALVYGDMATKPIEHLAALVDEVSETKKLFLLVIQYINK